MKPPHERLFITSLAYSVVSITSPTDCRKPGCSLHDIPHKFLKKRYEAQCGGSSRLHLGSPASTGSKLI